LLASSRASSKPVGPVLVAGSQHAGVTKAADEPADRYVVMGIRSTSGTCWSGCKIPTEMVFLVDVQAEMDRGELRDTGTAGSFRMVAPPAQCG